MNGKLSFGSLNLLILGMVIVFITVFSFFGCSEDEDSSHHTLRNYPVINNNRLNAITDTTAQCGGNITSDGGEVVTARGVCCSTSPTSTISDSMTSDGTGTVSFTS